jgi:hypothetical protein
MIINYKDKKAALNKIRQMIRNEIDAAGINVYSNNTNYLAISKDSPFFGIANICINEYSKQFSRRNSELIPSTHGHDLIVGQKPTETEIAGNTIRKGYQVAAVKRLEAIFQNLDEDCPRRITKEMSIDHVRTLYDYLKKRGY